MPASPSGLVIVDKPGGMTSHDVVARIRRLAATRRVGHAGTLDPMATGVLVVGIEKATRLLGYLSATTKQYAATIRLGQATSTDDAEGEVVTCADASGVGADELAAAVGTVTGQISQVPPGISAIKVDGTRAYKLTRAGKAPELAARTVTVHQLDVLEIRRAGALVDVDVVVGCSSGTYIRAIARDLGVALGTGGHLTALRRTRVGTFGLRSARTLEQLGESLAVIPIADAAAAAFPRIDLSAADAQRIAHGVRITAAGAGADAGAGGDAGTGADAAGGAQPQGNQGMAAAGGAIAAFGPDRELIALVTEADGYYRSLAVFIG